ncbi:hypothetical protein CLG96_14980 [Sphingomonas oleivorans]|uniref:Lipopolysaccharide assembly protein A domain-containing protein n=1 Tax=Sphingomonas oleivorans TaxID=1735121 RepID=A0A2T5FUU9_9SPHN|nr:hypothetical protein [Sphingomonas oleivorans]PTQ08507.1 hypothetical protein CLG96_14980 [Sphingomonas oleivorans]
MNFLRTLFWIVITVVTVVFSANNWKTVTINLWGGMQADAKLPALLLLAFLLGALPVYAWQRALRWRLGRRLELAERAAAEARGPAEEPQEPILPPGATPIAVPPAV